MAQVIPLPEDIPPTVEGDRIGGNFEKPPESLSRPKGAGSSASEAMIPGEAEEITFVFRGFNYTGGRLPKSVEERLWYMAPKSVEERLWHIDVGEEATIRDVYVYVNEITALYVSKGYALSFATLPEQHIKDGIVEIHLTKGFVERVEFVDKDVNGNAVKMASKIPKSRPLTLRVLERGILLMNDIPGERYTTVLSPSDNLDAASILRVERRERKRWGIEAEYNNSMPKSIDRHLFGARGYLNGVVTGVDQIMLSGWHSVTSDAYLSVAGGYSTAIGSDGLKIGLSGSYANIKPTDDYLTALDYVGKHTNAEVYMSYPIIRARSENLSVRLSASLSNSDADIAFDLLSDALTRDRLRTVAGDVTYDFADRFGGVSYMRLGMKRGLSVFDAKGNSRSHGRTNYTLTTMDIQRNQSLFNLMGGGLNVQLSGFAQISIGDHGLFSGAECAFGGARFGRGFDSGVATGESCFFGSAQLNWSRAIGSKIILGLHGYIDGGMVVQKGVLLAGELRNASVTTAGAGVNARVGNNLIAVSIGFPLTSSWEIAGQEDYRLRTSLKVQF